MNEINWLKSKVQAQLYVHCLITDCQPENLSCNIFYYPNLAWKYLNNPIQAQEACAVVKRNYLSYVLWKSIATLLYRRATKQQLRICNVSVSIRYTVHFDGCYQAQES